MRVSHLGACSRRGGAHGRMHDGASCPWEQGRIVTPAYSWQQQADTDAPRQDTLACMYPATPPMNNY